MRVQERPQLWAGVLVAVAFVTTFALLYGQAVRQDTAPFFPADRPAEWILYPIAPVPVRPKGELEATFTRRFVLEQAPAEARLAVRLHRSGSLELNGEPVAFARTEGVGWKRAREGEVAHLLRVGENTLVARAAARSGPPALWLQLEADDFTLVSDASWTTTLMGAEEAAARLATVSLADWPRAAEDPELQDRENPRPLSALRARAGELALLFVLGAGLAFAALRLVAARGDAGLPAGFWWLVWGGGCALWIALFVHNQGLNNAWGFDAASHRTYIRAVLQEGRLPLADEGWQAYQPPLYYLLAAVWLALAGHTSVFQEAVDWLRWLGLAAGCGQIGFLLLALRELFPRRPGLVRIGFVFGASLPVNLYLYQLVTNEILAATFASASLWWAIRMLRRGLDGVQAHAVLGVFLGLAMLAKFSALIPLTLCLGVLIAQRTLAQPGRLARHLGRIAITLVFVFAVCGWHYVRVAIHFDGNPFVGNWDDASGQAWWQDPGYHVFEDYTRFGLALERPLMSAKAGVPDALYSTLWGDGMISGVGRVHTPAPWKLDWMATGYALAVLPCLALFLGVVVGFVDFVRRPRAERFLSLAVLGATTYALLNMTLRLPFYAQAKAFYGLSALVPLAFCVSLGFDALALRARWLALAGIAWLLVWSSVSFMTFFGDSQRLGLDPTKMELTVDHGGHIEAARAAVRRGDREGAIASLQKAVALDPDRGQIGQLLAEQLQLAGRPEEALAATRAALRSSPAGQQLHLLAGELWLEIGKPEPAAYHFGAAATLLPSQAFGHIDDARRRQVEALRAAGQWREAIAVLEELREADALSPTLVRSFVPLLLAAPGELRDPALALSLAERAVAQTERRDPAVLEILAEAQAALGRSADAIRSQESAVEAWRAVGNEQRRLAAERRLEAYAGAQRRTSSAASP
jgi:tetratricopeptide (TPR) repeat protein